MTGSKGPAGGEDARPEGMNTYSFMWSIPNMVPLSAEEIAGMWEVRDGGGGSKKPVKKRVLESMQIQVRRMGWKEHAFLNES